MKVYTIPHMKVDAIIVLAGGIKQDASGRFVSTDLTAEDNGLGAPGGKLRAIAAAALAIKYNEAAVIASGGKGYDVPKNAPENRPLAAEILRDELIENGVPANRIMLEKNSNTTYQQLQELEKLIAEKHWRNVILIVNRYNLSRLHAMIKAKFLPLIEIVTGISAEEVLCKEDPSRWGKQVTEAYESQFMTERITKEEEGLLQIKNGTYQFR